MTRILGVTADLWIEEMTAYYNENDPEAVAALRELIADGVIASGEVDPRSIKDVTADDLRGFTQCHFFAGAGLWSVAARLAGWPDDRSIWTGSCPCQGESLAGKRAGASDPRHLWPDFYRLIRACRPPVLMGEQVAAAAGTHWLDRVCDDLANENYAARAVDIPACAVDAPHQRSRLYWIACAQSDSDRQWSDRGQRIPSVPRSHHPDAHGHHGPIQSSDFLQPDAHSGRRDGRPENAQRRQEERAAAERTDGGVFADAGCELRRGGPDIAQNGEISPNLHGRNGSWWADAEWNVSTLDEKARRTKPGLPMLVDGMVGRASVWRLAGNSIVPQLAAEVIAAFLDAEADLIETHKF